MSHLAFVAPPFLGHLHPMGSLAGVLVGRGHTVSFVGIGDAMRLAPRGCGFVALGRTSHPPGSLARMTAHMAAPHGLGFFRILRDMMRMTRMLCREMPDACREHGIDGIVADQLEPAGAIVARHLGLPHCSVANALPINRESGVPPPFTDWPYDPTQAGVRRNEAGYRVADLLMRPLGRVIAAESARLGAGAARTLDDCLSPTADITQLVPELDFPRLQPSAALYPCGPLRAQPETPLDETLLGTGKPIVFASLGTLQGGRVALFRAIATACAALDLHLVIAHGGRLSPAAIASLPGSLVVRDFVPQRTLLSHAALVITNGGLNTVLDAAAAGVPMLVVPIAFEQGAIAARVSRAGVGLTLPRRGLTPARLREAIAALMADRDVRARADRLAGALKSYGGAEAAASVVERVVGTARRQSCPVATPA